MRVETEANSREVCLDHASRVGAGQTESLRYDLIRIVRRLSKWRDAIGKNEKVLDLMAARNELI